MNYKFTLQSTRAFIEQIIFFKVCSLLLSCKKLWVTVINIDKSMLASYFSHVSTWLTTARNHKIIKAKIIAFSRWNEDQGVKPTIESGSGSNCVVLQKGKIQYSARWDHPLFTLSCQKRLLETETFVIE